MEIRFLGTADGVPRGERFCSCAMLKVNGVIYLIDAGAPIAHSVDKYGEEVASVRAVFTTHAHGDHIGELMDYISLLNWFSGCRELSQDFYVTDSRVIALTDDYIETLSNKPLDKERLRLHVVSEGEVYRDDNIKVTYFPNLHLKRAGMHLPSYSILIEAEGKKVLFTGDLSHGIKENDFPRVALEEDTDAVVCEFAHFTYEQVEPYLKRLRTKQLWLNHISCIKEKQEDMRSGLEGDAYPFPVHIAEDGDCFTV